MSRDSCQYPASCQDKGIKLNGDSDRVSIIPVSSGDSLLDSAIEQKSNSHKLGRGQVCKRGSFRAAEQIK
ncbi:MAG TPA: hypothetical protein DD713_02040 [Nitrospiraceae bacterium]|nr:hypothetical protein [Nitrospiraceae bacterium]